MAQAGRCGQPVEPQASYGPPVPSRSAWAQAVSRAEEPCRALDLGGPRFEQTLSMARTFGIGRMLALPSGDAFSGTSDFPPPLAPAFEATGPVTSPTHCPLCPFVSCASACAGFLPAAARRRDKTALSVLPPIRTGGVMSGGPIADLRHGTGHVRPLAPRLLSAAQPDRGGVDGNRFPVDRHWRLVLLPTSFGSAGRAG
jgi:hypothetical protein